MKRTSKKFFLRSFLGLVVVFLGVFIWKLFFSVEAYHVRLPVQFSAEGFPCLKVEIENRKYLLEAVLGSKFQMELHPNILKELEKTVFKTESWTNLKGLQFEAPSYKIPSINLGKLHFDQVVVVESVAEDSSTFSETSNSEDNEKDLKMAGCLGRPLLSKVNLLFDLKHALIIASNDIKKLQKDGYDLKTFIKVPLQITAKSINCAVDTEIGTLRLALDISASCNSLRKKTFYKEAFSLEKVGSFFMLPLKELVIGGFDFGKGEFLLLDITDKLDEIDGIIGMEFFRSHVVYFDFKHQVAYIRP